MVILDCDVCQMLTIFLQTLEQRCADSRGLESQSSKSREYCAENWAKVPMLILGRAEVVGNVEFEVLDRMWKCFEEYAQLYHGLGHFVIVFVEMIEERE